MNVSRWILKDGRWRKASDNAQRLASPLRLKRLPFPMTFADRGNLIAGSINHPGGTVRGSDLFDDVDLFGVLESSMSKYTIEKPPAVGKSDMRTLLSQLRARILLEMNMLELSNKTGMPYDVVSILCSRTECSRRIDLRREG